MIYHENTDVLVTKVIVAKMDIKILHNDIDRTHRIGKPKTKCKPRPVIFKFVWYNDSKKVFSSKKLLKDSVVSITAIWKSRHRHLGISIGIGIGIGIGTAKILSLSYAFLSGKNRISCPIRFSILPCAACA